jgi:hypothetical protein
MSAFPHKSDILNQFVTLAHCFSWVEPFVSPSRSFDRWLAASGNFHMYEDLIAPWLMQYPTIWTALLIGLVPAMIANFKRRSVMRWYAYGFACSLVALPLVTLPTGSCSTLLVAFAFAISLSAIWFTSASTCSMMTHVGVLRIGA